MLNEQALVQRIFRAALEGCDGDVSAHKQALWIAGLTLLADVLRQSDQFTQERLLRGMVFELRASIGRLSELLRPPAPPPNTLN